MATKRMPAAASLTVVKSESPLTLTSVNSTLNSALNLLSKLVTSAKVEDLGEMYPALVRLTDITVDIKGEVRNRIQLFVREFGSKKTEKGTMIAASGGFVFEIQPARTGIDSKKLEALLRAKGQDASMCMDAKVSYVANDGKLADAVRRGLLTSEEVETCRYDLSYRVMEPRKVE